MSPRKKDDPSSRRTLLIGSDALSAAWAQHAGEASQTIAVAYTDLARTLDIIDRTHPEVVVFEQALASTKSGQLLMERLYSERAVRGLDISVLPAHGVNQLLTAGPGSIHPERWLTGLTSPLPPRPVRVATRVRAGQDERVLIDGHPAALLDLSTTGARVRSTGSLRPNQHIRVVLPARGSLKIAGVVVWSRLEGGPPLQYHAGIAFVAPLPELTEDERVPPIKAETPKKPRAPRQRKAR